MRPTPLPKLALFAATLALHACSDGDPTNPALLSDLSGGPVFLTQSEPATAVMEALFDGRVLLDDAGCLRLDIGSPEDATVVWPYGATLEPAGGSFRVIGENGDTIGSVGGHFRFGGGFVSELHEGIALNDEARAQAEARCPGSYWIVGEVP